jgi:uncharacterized membrane protein YkgB
LNFDVITLNCISILIQLSKIMDDISTKFNKAGKFVTRYALAIVLIWVGSLKFITYEVELIQGLISNSPFISWMLAIGSVTGVAAFIGTIEIITGVLIALRPVNARLSAIGSCIAISIFTLTATFLLTTPGMIQEGMSFPALSFTAQFVAKDLILIGAAIWTAGEAFGAARQSAV